MDGVEGSGRESGEPEGGRPDPGATGGLLVYRDRNGADRSGAGDDGEDVDFEDLGGQ